MIKMPFFRYDIYNYLHWSFTLISTLNELK